MTPRTPGFFPAPPQPPVPMTTTNMVDQGDAQRTRFAELRNQIAAMDLPTDALQGLTRAANVESITGLEEIDPSPLNGHFTLLSSRGGAARPESATHVGTMIPVSWEGVSLSRG